MSRPEFFEGYFAINIGGRQLADDELARINGSVEIVLDAEKDDQAKFAFDESIEYTFQDRYRENMDVTIEYGHLRGDRAMFVGEISSVKPEFPESGVPSIKFECSSKAKNGHERQRSKTYSNKTYSDVAQEIAKLHGWETSVEPTTQVIRQITQAGETDIQFLKRLAAKLNYIVKVVGSTLYFGKQPVTGEDRGTFDYRSGNFLIKSFMPKFEATDKGKRIAASNINEKEQKQVTTKAWGTTDKQGTRGGTELVATSAAGPQASGWKTQGKNDGDVSVAQRPEEPTAAGSRPEPIARSASSVALMLGRAKTGIESAVKSAIEDTGETFTATSGGVGKDTTYYLRDAADGGALPDNAEEIQTVTAAKQRDNEKVVRATLNLAVCQPLLRGNSKIVVRGVGPRFSGTYLVEKAKHTISTQGALTTLDLSRNALGDDSNTIGGEAAVRSTTGTSRARVNKTKPLRLDQKIYKSLSDAMAEDMLERFVPLGITDRTPVKPKNAEELAAALRSKVDIF